MDERTYAGKVLQREYGEADDVIYLSTMDEPLAESLDWMHKKQVTVRYWVTDDEQSKDDVQREFMLSVLGVADVDFGAVYSECTGHLWTDEELNVGGHDLLGEIRTYVGKWLILEITTREDKPQ